MTPEEAAERAAAVLDKAADLADLDLVDALVDIADGWTRLHTALANAPKTIEPAPVTVNIEGLAGKEVDPKQVADYVALATGYVPKQEPEIGVYSERARLIAYLATQYPAKIAYNDPNEPDWPVIYLDTSHGQLSWHLSPDDLWLFKHVAVVGPGDDIPQWDGHTTAEKYNRLVALVRYEAESAGLI